MAGFDTDSNYGEHLQWKSLQGGFPFFLSDAVFCGTAAWFIPSYNASNYVGLLELKELL